MCRNKWTMIESHLSNGAREGGGDLKCWDQKLQQQQLNRGSFPGSQVSMPQVNLNCWTPPSPSLHSSRCKIIAGQTAEWVTDVEDEWTDCNRCVLIILLTGHLAVAMDHCKRSAAASWQLVHNEGCNQNNTLLVDEVAGRMNDFPGNESQNLNYDPSSAKLFLFFFSA